MTISWPPGVSALDVSVVPFIGEKPRQQIVVLCVLYINQIKNIM